jgi:hypothetical protein
VSREQKSIVCPPRTISNAWLLKHHLVRSAHPTRTISRREK